MGIFVKRTIMRYKNKITAIFAATMMLGAFAVSCEEDEIYVVNSPSWIDAKVDSIAEAKANQVTEEVVIPGLQEDVYSFGKTDFTSGWWQDFSKDYPIPYDSVWHAQFNLNINPDGNYYNNFALVVTNDDVRGGATYKEYGAYRYDFTNDSAAFNSQWGSHLFFKFSESNQVMSPVDNKDAGLQKLAGLVTLSIENRPTFFSITITNGTVTKTYKQPYPMPSLNEDPANRTMRAFLCVEGSFIDFKGSTTEPSTGFTSASDKLPLSMVLNNVPAVFPVEENMDIDSLMAGVTATVTYEEGVTAEIPATDLTFMAIPDLTEIGKKTLVASYAKTFKGESATPVLAYAPFEIVAYTKIVVDPVTIYYVPDCDTVSISKWDVVAKGVDAAGVETVFNADLLSQLALSATSFEAKDGKHTVKASWNGFEAETEVNVVSIETIATAGTLPEGNQLGTDVSTAWWSVFTPDTKVEVNKAVKYEFIVNSAAGENWHSSAYILRNTALAEYGVCRTDNHGWGTGYENNVKLVKECNWNWDTFKSDINGANFTLYVLNSGDNTADIYIKCVTSTGAVYFQNYKNFIVDSSDLNVSITCEASYLVF